MNDGEKKIYKEFIKQLQHQLGDGYIVIDKEFKPKIHKPGDLSSNIFNDNSVKKIEAVSPYIKSLNESTADIPALHVSILCENIKLDTEKQANAKSIFLNVFQDYLFKLFQKDSKNTSTKRKSKIPIK